VSNQKCSTKYRAKKLGCASPGVAFHESES
jgi:hypothetical protein